MERSHSFDYKCPLVCLIKSALFIVVTVVVLYMPLGDPDVECERKRITAASCKASAAVCCLCNLYKLMIKTTYAIIDILETMVCLLMEVLYEAKLKFYQMLEAVDRYDLCRTVTCGKEVQVNTVETKDLRTHRSCTCSRTKHPD